MPHWATFNEREIANMNRYENSLRQLERAEKVIPLGAQTYSKSKKTFPPGLAPLYLDRAQGGRTWDIDGNEYVDLISSLAAVNLGHADPEISAAVADQLYRGSVLSLSTPLEAEVAELIVDLVPSAEKVRFGKNGSDATTAAVRIARTHTGRDHIVTLGYHGWQDWFIGSMPSRGLGVPAAYGDLIHPIEYGNLEALERELTANPVAAVMLEAMTSHFPEPGYLQALLDTAHAHGALVIFDEMVTGFRLAPGGAQEYFGVTPDLSTLGKGIANGFPLSAVAGRADLMNHLEDIFFSGTFGGELLSLTAAKITLERIKNTDALTKLAETGQVLADRVEAVIKVTGLKDVISLSGHPAWKFVLWNPQTPNIEQLKYLFMQEMSRNGVLMIATHNVTAAHNDADIDHVVHAYRSTLQVISEAIINNNAAELLRADISGTGKSVR